MDAGVDADEGVDDGRAHLDADEGIQVGVDVDVDAALAGSALYGNRRQ